MKKYLNITFFLFLILFLFIRCEKQNEAISKSQNVLLYLKESDTLLKSVALDITDINDFNSVNSSLKYKEDTDTLAFLFSIDEPQLLRINGVDAFTIPLTIYVTPGDTLIFHSDENNQMIFEGKNASHYNFYTKLGEKKYLYPKFQETGTIEGYKTQCKQVYKQKTIFLKEYAKQKTVDPLFIKKIEDNLKFEYLWNLTRPKENITSLDKYLTSVKISDFDRDDMLDSWFFRIALMNYIHLATAENNEYESYSKSRLNSQINYINTNLSGKVRQYTITKTILVYNKNLSPELIEPLKGIIKTYLPELEKNIYKKELELVYGGLERLNNPLSEELLNSKLTDLQGNSTTLKEVLEQQANSVKIIDFWASWCAPCIESIQKSYDFRTQLSKENDVSWLYFSIDKDVESWKKKVTELKSYGMNKNQYLIDTSNKKDITYYFNIDVIPHYTLLDNKNNLIMIKIPSPSDSLAFRKMIQEVKILQ